MTTPTPEMVRAREVLDSYQADCLTAADVAARFLDLFGRLDVTDPADADWLVSRLEDELGCAWLTPDAAWFDLGGQRQGFVRVPYPLSAFLQTFCSTTWRDW